MVQNFLQVQQAKSCLRIHRLTRFEHPLASGIGDPKRNGGDEKYLQLYSGSSETRPVNSEENIFLPMSTVLELPSAEGCADT